MKKIQRTKEIIHLFKCLSCCATNFDVLETSIKCKSCGNIFPCINGVPILSNTSSVKVVDINHQSNQAPPEILSCIKSITGYSLNIGAGSTSEFIPNCVELEYSIFRNTDVVADAHNLPFQDEIFELVVVLNAFEHFKDPKQVSDEIFRVLKPGGKVIIHTAFLQPLHEEPYHFYNATKYGVLAWFEKFKASSCEVPENFHVGHTLSWLASELLYNLGKVNDPELPLIFSKMTIQEWSNLWRNPNERIGNKAWHMSSLLPQEIQERFSAGFQYEGTKPDNSKAYDEHNLNVHPNNYIKHNNNSGFDINNDEFITHNNSHEKNTFIAEETKISSITVYVTSFGNYFMTEFAQVFVDGFSANNIPSELAIDKIPSTNPDNKNIQIILSPHEFYNLFLDNILSQDEIEKITRASYFLSGEQPNTPWFDIFCQRAKGTKGIFDINYSTTEAFLKAKLPAIHVPLGYSPLFEAGTKDLDNNDKRIDLLFLGSHSLKRELFISSNASVFNRYNSYIAFSRLDRAKSLDTPGFYGDIERNRLARKSKIMVNVHWTNNTYFEWLRAMIAIANKCLFISEYSDHTAPLIKNSHFIMSSLDDLDKYCEYFLLKSDERDEIVNNAYTFITKKFSSKIHCQKILKKVSSDNNS